jgi:hypothetical protein
MGDYLNCTFTETDIDKYISTQSEESINLEFKRGDALKFDEKVKKEIAKDISAFANSDGGIIVYGIEEKDYKANNLVFVDGNIISKEWLEQVINSRIHRKIDGLTIDPIRYNNKIEQTIYIVKIPRSLNAPHAADKRFYKRYNFESVEMEEYEIRNLYTRQDKTILEIEPPIISLNPGAFIGGKPTNFSANIQINIINKGQTIEKLYKVEVRIPFLLTSESVKYGLTHPFFKRFARNENGYAVYSIPNESPLFQNELATVATVNLKLNVEHFHDIQSNPIIINLRYSNGIETISFLLIDQLEYNGRKLTLDLLKR